MHLTLEFGCSVQGNPTRDQRLLFLLSRSKASNFLTAVHCSEEGNQMPLRSLRSGGLELLCQSIKIHHVDVDLKAGEEKLSMKDLLCWIHTNVIKERPEMFMKEDSVRPGVLVLVNDTDWELSGNLDTKLEENDVVVFISTLHGG